MIQAALSVFGYQVQQGDFVLLAAGVLIAMVAAYRSGRLLGVIPLYSRAESTFGLAWQMGFILALEQAYEFTRATFVVQPVKTDIAFTNAYRILDFELFHGFFVEERLERFMFRYHALMSGIDAFYLACHVAVTIGVLVYLYARHRRSFWLCRNVLIVTTALALFVFYVFPTAPPRFLTQYGFIDPAVVNHLVAEGGSQPGSYTYNPYAAMPSIHVGYALIVALGLVHAHRRLVVRVLAALYPIAMSLVVIASGNHWVLDVVGALVTVVLSYAAVWLATWLRAAGQRALAGSRVQPAPRPALQAK